MYNHSRPPLLEALLSLALTLLVMWETLSAEERRWLSLKTAELSRRVLAALAAREGRAGMSDELAGRAAAPRYNTAYWLATARDRITEAMRP